MLQIVVLLGSFLVLIGLAVYNHRREASVAQAEVSLFSCPLCDHRVYLAHEGLAHHFHMQHPNLREQQELERMERELEQGTLVKHYTREEWARLQLEIKRRWELAA